ncbi:MAG: hypothetical protein GEU93_09250, partial [Propionibacteriales bacterium]|nr:hypothetical protein [Propionibacteriales bacterium]
ARGRPKLRRPPPQRPKPTLPQPRLQHRHPPRKRTRIHLVIPDPSSQVTAADLDARGELTTSPGPSGRTNRSRRINGFRTLSDIAPAAHQALSAEIWDYVCGGAGTEATVRRNRKALDRLLLRPRMLRGVADRDTTTTLLGTPLAFPVVLAPVGGLSLFTPQGALSVAYAAHATGIVPFVGILTSPRLEDVAADVNGPLFFQLYVQGDRSWLTEMVRRVEAAEFSALAVTVDTPIHPRRERDIRNDFVPEKARERPNLTGTSRPSTGRDAGRFRMSFDWDELGWLRSITELPLVVKGILTPEDAGLAAELGADAIYVSNHGGRQLDHAPATIEMLPAVVQAVAGRAQVIVDGGFARGTDVVKALALGADAVAIGRLMCWALAAGGRQGLEHALHLLQEEVSVTMAQLGVTTVSALGPESVMTAPA